MSRSTTRGRGIVALAVVVGAFLLWRWIDAPRVRRGAPAPDAAAPESREPAPIAEAEVAADGDARAPIDTEAERTAIFGRVAGTEGGALVGAHVVLHDAHGGSRVSDVADEHHRASELAPGDWWLSASAPGRRRATIAVAALAGGEERRVDVELAPCATLEVFATDGAGHPLRVARPRAEGGALAQAFRFTPVASTAPIGPRFPWRAGGSRAARFGPRTAADPETLVGRLELDAPLPLHVALTCYQGVLAEELVLPGATRVEFALDDRALRERLADVSFELGGQDVFPGVGLGEPKLWAPGAFDVPLRDGPGGFGASGLPPGEYALVWTQRGLRRAFTLVAGETLELGTLALVEPLELRGRVRLVDGSTPPPANEDQDDYPRFAFGGTGPWAGETALDDTYRVAAGSAEEILLALQPDTYTLQWRVGSFATQPFVVALDAGTPALELTAHALAPLVLEPSDDPAAYGVRIFDAHGVELERLPFAHRWPVRVELVPGPLQVVVADAGGRVLGSRFVVLDPGGTRVALGR